MNDAYMLLGWLTGKHIAGQANACKRILAAYLYNKVRLPKLPECDNENYPYMALAGDETSATVVYSSMPLYQKHMDYTVTAPSGYMFYNGYLLPKFPSNAFTTTQYIYKTGLSFVLVTCDAGVSYDSIYGYQAKGDLTNDAQKRVFSLTETESGTFWGSPSYDYSFSTLSLPGSPSNVIWSESNIYGMDASSPTSTYVIEYDGLYAEDNGSVMSYVYSASDESPEWQRDTKIDGEFPANSAVSNSVFITIWSNYQFCDYDNGDVLIAPSDPIPVYDYK